MHIYLQQQDDSVSDTAPRLLPCTITLSRMTSYLRTIQCTGMAVTMFGLLDSLMGERVLFQRKRLVKTHYHHYRHHPHMTSEHVC
mmetsp:Transcript_52063/g.71085  ORF Transcript_52063/g.71085 Transcript_52063/m.71085 type:complete len:85 (-) Transcript_52063:154-408(-)